MPQAVRISRKAPVPTWAASPQRVTRDTRPMRNREFRKICAELGINDCGTAARITGLSWRTCQRYYYKEQDIGIPPPLARFLRLAKKTRMSHKELLAL